MPSGLEKQRDARLMARQDRLFGYVILCAVWGIVALIGEQLWIHQTSKIVQFCLGLSSGYGACWITSLIWRNMIRRRRTGGSDGL